MYRIIILCASFARAREESKANAPKKQIFMDIPNYSLLAVGFSWSRPDSYGSASIKGCSAEASEI